MPYVKPKEKGELLVEAPSKLKYHFANGEVKEISTEAFVKFFKSCGKFDEVSETEFLEWKNQSSLKKEVFTPASPVSLVKPKEITEELPKKKGRKKKEVD